MRIIFMGSTEFGFTCLEKLLEMKKSIVAIYTIPQSFTISYSKKPVKIVTHKNFKTITQKFNIPMVEVTGKMKQYVNQIKNYKPDFIFVAGWYYIIPKVILDIPRLCCAGIHASLLPQYRGGAPLVWAIINGEKKAGVSFFYFVQGVDNGDIIAQKEFSITRKDTIKTVYDKATAASLQILKKYIPLIEMGRAPRIEQNEAQATYFPQRRPEQGLIDWNKTSWEIYNWIRAQTKPYPGALFFDKKGQKIKAWSAKLPTKIDKIPYKSGFILSQDEKEIKIATKDGYVTITDWEIKK
ncbi:methionyl-tRNA formyltransferase [Patescibacteria group bacterium AH-259-L05]|nr:methionyl-tRNA formyltransferase [Patescibacteria group bacterium AH-259-L05]